MALTTAYIATLRGRPPDFADGNSPAINSHCSHVKLLGYALLICSQGAVIYKFQHILCELSYNSLLLLKHPLTEIEISKLVEDRVVEQLQKVLNVLPNQAVLVVYIRPGKQRINAIDGLSQKVKYYASANTPVNLIGTVVDSAYVADAWKKC